MEKKFNFVYITTNLINNKQYVGDHSTDNLECSTTKNYLGSGRPYFKNAKKKYGKENFKREILEYFSTKREASDAQEKYIHKFKTHISVGGYNISWKGGHNVKECWSEESKEKLSNTQKGHIAWNKGLTKETDKRIKKAWNKGLTKETDERVMKMVENLPNRATQLFTRQIIKQSTSEREAILKVGRTAGTWGYKKVKEYVIQNNIDVSHFDNQKYQKEDNKRRYKPASHYLNSSIPISNRRLKDKLFGEGIFEKRCAKCLRSSWFEEPLWLHLHHKDGNKKNNSLENLQILCPNCHSMTSNFCFRGRTHSPEARHKIRQKLKEK